MAHHENHCGSLFTYIKCTYFEVGVIMTSRRLKSGGIRRQGDGVEELGPLSRRKRWTHMGGKCVSRRQATSIARKVRRDVPLAAFIATKN